MNKIDLPCCRVVFEVCFSANQIFHIWQGVREARTSGVGGSQRSRFLAQTRRIAALGDENVRRQSKPSV